MLELFDRATRRKIAILENALNIKEEEKLNAIGYLSFSLPYNDPKNDLCRAYHYVRYNGGQLYRLLPRSIQRSDTGTVDYTAEHVVATLLDNVLFGFHVIGNLGYYTADCIRYILDHQMVQNWVLGECDFARQFEYGFEQENLLGALFSLPQPFTDPYQWTFDTSRYPWVLNLKALDTEANPGLYIYNRHNLTQLSHESDPTDICTRLYPLGYGEGVNQLGIQEVNGGLPYLQSPQEILDQYGIVERVWVDRRYENAESLKAAAQAMLEELQIPAESYSVSFANLSEADQNTAALGEVVRIVDRELGFDRRTVITAITRDYGNIPASTITIANRPKDIADTVADLADRQRIEMTYSQGATNLYAQSLQANADQQSGAVIRFWIPAEMRIVNKVLAKVQLQQFRAYSQATEAAGSTDSTSSAGGASSSTSESGGRTTRSSSSDGGFSVTSGASSRSTSSSASDTGNVYDTSGPDSSSFAGHTHRSRSALPAHSHTISHTHTVSSGSHTHDVSIPSHTHRFSVGSHTHRFEIPAHSHQIQPGIYFFGGANAFIVRVNGVEVQTVNASTAELDLTDALVQDGVIPRGVWHEVDIVPNGLSYVSIDMFVQGFIQSRGDATV